MSFRRRLLPPRSTYPPGRAALPRVPRGKGNRTERQGCVRSTPGLGRENFGLPPSFTIPPAPLLSATTILPRPFRPGFLPLPLRSLAFFGWPPLLLCPLPCSSTCPVSPCLPLFVSQAPFRSHSPSHLGQQPQRVLSPSLKYATPSVRELLSLRTPSTFAPSCAPGSESWGRRQNGPGKGHFWKELIDPLATILT